METANKLRDRLNQAMPLLAGAAFVLVLGVTAIVVLCSGTVALPQGETCAQCVREWIGALSGWFAGLVGVFAVGAALLTVATIREQIEAAREDSLRISNQAKEIIDAKLYNIFKDIELGWRYLDCHDNPNIHPEFQERARRLARPTIRHAIKIRELKEIEEALPSVLPISRERLRAILWSLRQILDLSQTSNSEKENITTWGDTADTTKDEDRIITLAVYLSHLTKEIDKYENFLYKIFENRVKYPVNHDPMWKHAEGIVEKTISSWIQRSKNSV